MENEFQSGKSVISLFQAQIAESRASDRSFGLLFSVIFFAIGLAPLRHGAQIAWWAVAAGVAFALIAVTAPGALRKLKVAWLFLGFCLGLVVSPIVLAILFYFLVTPVGVVRRMFGGDPLLLRKPQLATYWRIKTDPASDMTDQF